MTQDINASQDREDRCEFYIINNEQRLGMELGANEEYASEQQPSRFGLEGKYASLNVSDHVIVDFRKYDNDDVLAIRAIQRSQNKDYTQMLTVFFKEVDEFRK